MCRSYMNVLIVLLSIAIGTEVAVGDPVGTAFTYQGQLKDAGVPLNDSADFQFTLWDAPNEGASQIGPMVAVNNVDVVKGLFTAELDFGAGAFAGDARWVQISVRSPAGSGPFTTLSPRQEITPAPYSLYALDAPGGGGSGYWAANGDHIYNTTSGNVGVGTSNPLWKLDVVNPATGGSVEIGFSADDTSGALAAYSSTFLFPHLARRVGIFSNAIAANGLDLRADGDASDIRLYTGGFGPENERMRITDAGNVGIGTASPGAKLEVAGQVKITGGTPGAGKVLTSDAAGLATWETAAGGGGFWQAVGNDIVNTNNGNVGIGVVPSLRLHIKRTTGLPSGPPTRLGLEWTSIPGGESWCYLAVNANDFTEGTDFFRETNTPLRFSTKDEIDSTTTFTQMILAGNGNLGIGTTPSWKLDVLGNIMGSGFIGAQNPNTGIASVALGWGQDAGGNDVARIRIAGDGPGATNGLDIQRTSNVSLMRILHNGNVGIGTTNPVAKLDVAGTARVHVLEIVGADLAEKFPVSETVVPGMVVAIDPDHPGHLCLARGAYNRRVAGVVSGANDLPAGAILGNLPGNESAPAIALSGRVWVSCDAINHAITPGDLLTTAETPGHAAKVVDYPRAQGAIIGKAMTGLDHGTGLVLVLVSLQ